jgi:CheY-like chemotaxis protein
MKPGNPPLHLLFVDDDSDESYLFNEALQHAGLLSQLSKAKDGNDLIAFLKSNPLPDMVLIDLNMPHKDGLEALAEVRSLSQFNDLPLIIYSTASNPTFIDQCYEKGANLYITKPNDFDGMVDVVKTIFNIDWKEFGRPTRENFVIRPVVEN